MFNTWEEAVVEQGHVEEIAIGEPFIMKFTNHYDRDTNAPINDAVITGIVKALDKTTSVGSGVILLHTGIDGEYKGNHPGVAAVTVPGKYWIMYTSGSSVHRHVPIKLLYRGSM